MHYNRFLSAHPVVSLIPLLLINRSLSFFFQEDLLIHGDSVYDIIDKQDHGPIQAELGRSVPQQAAGHHHHPHHHSHLNHHHATHLDGERRMFLCRMNVSRNARRQMRFGDQKVIFFMQNM